jgi:hypothetical protein
MEQKRLFGLLNDRNFDWKQATKTFLTIIGLLFLILLFGSPAWSQNPTLGGPLRFDRSWKLPSAPGINQLRVADITYIRLQRKSVFRLNGRLGS